MTFSIIQNSTATDQVTANENFYHIAQGSISPMGGNILANTTGVYDLGSSVYRWKTLNCNRLDITSEDESIYYGLVASVEITTPATSFNITGLTTTNYHYKLIGYILAGNTTASYSILNNAVSNTAYRAYRITNYAGTTSVQHACQIATDFLFDSLFTNGSYILEYDIFNIGSVTVMYQNATKLNTASASIAGLVHSAFTSDQTTTGLYFAGYFAAGTKFKLYRSAS